jgi:hypothetical protein
MVTTFRNDLFWFFYCVNDNAKVSFEAPQIMHCLYSINFKLDLFLNPEK